MPGIPILSTRDDRRAHRLVRWPYHWWCKYCVLGCGKQRAHARSDSRRDCPQVYLDYCFVALDGDANLANLLILADRSSGAVEVINVQGKGPSSYPIEVCVRALRTWGVKKVVLTCDQEPAILALVQAIAAGRDEQTILQPGPKYDPKSKGYIEATDGIVEQTCGMGAYSLRREEAFGRFRGREFKGFLVEPMECVLFRKQGHSPSKLEARWAKGIWFGKKSDRGEHIIGTSLGQVLARTLARRPDSRRWQSEALSPLVCTPWEPKASLTPIAPTRGSAI